MDRARLYAVAVSVALVAATLLPLRRDPYDDGFPMSTYPMFASKRATVQTYTYALGVTKDGKRRTLSPSIIGGTGEILQALQVVDRALRSGSLPALCKSIASRVREHDNFADVVAIRIVTGTHNSLTYLAGHVIGPEQERVRCEVQR
ncbi:MAG: hypothetical protein HOV81_37325 [Kofleriaceae bacterium]|nr:hypothetical protein [Kofleriaceae bacterium]